MQFKQERDTVSLVGGKALVDLHAALRFVRYIATRYEQGWADPITERFYNEAVALLNAQPTTAVEGESKGRRHDMKTKKVRGYSVTFILRGDHGGELDSHTALTADDDPLNERAVVLAQWLLDTKPTLFDGDRIEIRTRRVTLPNKRGQL